MSQRPIADYALISDCHSAALVSSAGSIDWLCMPRFDAPSIFGRLLDERAGHWSIHPTHPATVSRRYVDRTLVLETEFRTDRGTVILQDTMPVARTGDGHQLGAAAPHAVLRCVSCIAGDVEMELEYAPRGEYGLVTPLLTQAERGGVARAGASVLLLSSPVDLTVVDATMRARFALRAGESVCFALQHHSTSEPEPHHLDEAEIRQQIADTITAWQSWSSLHQRYDGPWCELVLHSGRVLQGLMFAPTGAIVAAPTTSLPETPGGSRNWDYRYTWVRDASLTLNALWVAACPLEAHKFFNFIASTALTQVRRGGHLQIMFGIGGEHDLTERELPHLSGWRDSRPVRIGNGAWNQRQLDVYGELLDAAFRLRDYLTDLDETTREFLARAADSAAALWKQKDNGIWEMRTRPQHFLHSKLMCWVALDRAMALADTLNASHERIHHWQTTRDKIRNAILKRGWNRKIGAFTQAFGSRTLDASALMMAITGFLPATDPRMIATINAIADQLTDERGLVYRYLSRDALPGTEGSFLLCTFWLAETLAATGAIERARETFARAIAFANDVGLLAEEVDPATGELRGNFPQAFSHIGLVNAAWAITQAEEVRTGSP